MNKTILYASITICGLIGGYLPVLLGAGSISGWSILGSTIGGIVGVFVARKLSM